MKWIAIPALTTCFLMSLPCDSGAEPMELPIAGRAIAVQVRDSEFLILREGKPETVLVDAAALRESLLAVQPPDRTAVVLDPMDSSQGGPWFVTAQAVVIGAADRDALVRATNAKVEPSTAGLPGVWEVTFATPLDLLARWKTLASVPGVESAEPVFLVLPERMPE